MKWMICLLASFDFLVCAAQYKKLNEVVVFPHATTMVANGRDSIGIDFWINDTTETMVKNPGATIRVLLRGDGKIIGAAEDSIIECHIAQERCRIYVRSSNAVGKIKLIAKADGYYEGNTDITTISPSNVAVVTPIDDYVLNKAQRKKRDPGLMLGADISFLPELEARGMRFYDKGVQKDAIEILKAHGFNYIRLRIFNEPAL